jgi:hypothetical protein
LYNFKFISVQKKNRAEEKKRGGKKKKNTGSESVIHPNSEFGRGKKRKGREGKMELVLTVRRSQHQLVHQPEGVGQEGLVQYVKNAARWEGERRAAPLKDWEQQLSGGDDDGGDDDDGGNVAAGKVQFV